MTTKQDLERAPMFALFPGARPGQLGHRRELPNGGEHWAIFEHGSGSADDVREELLARGLVEYGAALGQEPQRIDDEAPDDFDDLDAAVAAIAAGFTLCKVPDAMPGGIGEHHYRMAMLDDVRGGWVALPDATVATLVERSRARSA